MNGTCVKDSTLPPKTCGDPNAHWDEVQQKCICNTGFHDVNGTCVKDSTPPLAPPSVSSILHFAWSMTMALSGQEQQNEVVTEAKTQLDGYWKASGDNSKTADFYAESLLLVISSLRTYGVHREAFKDQQAYWKIWKDERTNYYSSLGDMIKVTSDGAGPSTGPSSGDRCGAKYGAKYGPGTGTGAGPSKGTTISSKDGWTTRIIGILGGGSLTALVGGPAVFERIAKNFTDSLVAGNNSTLQPQISKLTHDILMANATLAKNSTLQPQISKMAHDILATNATLAKTTQMVTTSLDQILHNPILPWVLVFLIGGGITYGIISYFLKYLSGRRKLEIEFEFNRKMDETWKKDLRPSFVVIYTNLGKEIKKLYKKYFEVDDTSLPQNDDELRRYISEYILPSENVYRITPIIEKDVWKRLDELTKD